MKQHRQQIIDDLSSCSSRAKSFFALLCAERLRNCCRAYEAISGASLEAFFKWTDILFELHLDEGFKSSIVTSAIQELESLVPTGGEPLFAQAQCGVICLLSAFEMFANGNRLSLTDSVNAVVDALNNYDFCIRRRIQNDTTSSANYTLLRREMDRQNLDVAFVRNHYGHLDEITLMKCRYENLQFVVPIAV